MLLLATAPVCRLNHQRTDFLSDFAPAHQHAQCSGLQTTGCDHVRTRRKGRLKFQQHSKKPPRPGGERHIEITTPKGPTPGIPAAPCHGGMDVDRGRGLAVYLLAQGLCPQARACEAAPREDGSRSQRASNLKLTINSQAEIFGTWTRLIKARPCGGKGQGSFEGEIQGEVVVFAKQPRQAPHSGAARQPA